MLVMVFFDDIPIYSKILENHLHHLHTVLETLKSHKISAKISRCAFGNREVEYLGYLISHKGVKANP